MVEIELTKKEVERIVVALKEREEYCNKMNELYKMIYFKNKAKKINITSNKFVDLLINKKVF